MSFYCNAHEAVDDACSDCLGCAADTIKRLKSTLENVVNKCGWHYPEGLHPDGDELKEAKALLKELE